MLDFAVYNPPERCGDIGQRCRTAACGLLAPGRFNSLQVALGALGRSWRSRGASHTAS